MSESDDYMMPYFLDNHNHRVLNLQNPNVLRMLYYMNQSELKSQLNRTTCDACCNGKLCLKECREKDRNVGYNWRWLLESMGYKLDDETVEMGKTWPRVQEGMIIVGCFIYIQL